MDPDDRIFVASWLHLTLKTAGAPYGFDPDGCRFERDTGDYLASPAGKGLTCATFIVAVFESLGYESPIDISTVPLRDEDVAWQRSLVRHMGQWGASVTHLQAVANDIGCKRLRPEEVTAACLLEDWPVSYPRAEPKAAEILSDIGRSP